MVVAVLDGHLPVSVACSAAVFAAFRLSHRSVRAVGALRVVWALFAGLTAGIAVWTAHVASLLSHTQDVATGFAPGQVIGALGLAAAGCAATFLVIAWRADLEARAAAGLVFGLTSWGALAVLHQSAVLETMHRISPQGAGGALVLLAVASVAACGSSGARKSVWRAAAAATMTGLGMTFSADLFSAAYVPLEGPPPVRPAYALEAVHVVALAGLIGAFLTVGGAGVGVMHARGKNAHLGRLRAAIDAMPAGLGFYDAEDRLQVWNQRYVEIMSEPCRAMIRKGVTFRELIDRDLEQGSYLEARGREAVWREERLAVRRDGHGAQIQKLDDGRWLRVEERRTADGGCVSICVDVTDVKRQEESFRLLFEANPAPMWLWDPKTLRFLDMNEAARQAYSVAADEVDRLTVLDFLEPDERAALAELGRRRVQTYRGERVWRHVTRTGEVLHALPYVQLATYEGRPALLAAMLDVSERVRSEQELQRHAAALEEARDEAEAANRAKSAFLANMSHEIRTPLNGVIAVADVLAGTDLGPGQREMVDLIRNSGVTLEALLSDVLDLARVEAGRFELEREPFDLRRAIKDVAALAELKAAEKSVPVRLSIADDVPETVRGDVTRVKQVLTNLVSNAVKFTSEGDVRLNVTAADGRVRCVVADTGAGFDAEQKQRIFARFQQADGSITRRYGGTGLGLAISRELVSLMGGELDCDSVPGRGSTFVVDLPFEVCEAKPCEAPKAAVAPVGDAPVRVLLADDHPTNRRVVSLILQPLGVDLVEAEDGAAALALFERERFDVVLMDMQMPVMDGLTATREIRAREAASGGSRTPVVMLTANAMPEHVHAGQQAGADDHLSKPIHAAALIGAIERAVAEAQARSEASAPNGRQAA